MRMNKLVPLVTTDKLREVKVFYRKHFQFEVIFENESYLGLRSPGEEGGEIGFMIPEGEQPVYDGKGLTLCFEVSDVDAEHDRLRSAELPVVRELQDNPWGDRSFIVSDPIGVAIYVYKTIPPSAEFAGDSKG